MTPSETLRKLHIPGDPLVLPNAWDAASARMVEAAGFPAVATSSSAVAAVLGYDDGEAAPVAEMLAAATRIARSVSVPVTVDFERGYRLPPAELVERLASTGAAGLNLEDSDPATGRMIDAHEQADFLAAVRAAATSQGTDLVINARTDSFLRHPATDQTAPTINRATQYLAAGADCIYPIALNDPQNDRIPRQRHPRPHQHRPNPERKITRRRPHHLRPIPAPPPLRQVQLHPPPRHQIQQKPLRPLTQHSPWGHDAGFEALSDRGLRRRPRGSH